VKDLESFLLSMKPSTTCNNRLHAAKCQQRFKDDDDIVFEHRRTNEVRLCSSLNVDAIIKNVSHSKNLVSNAKLSFFFLLISKES
jgi:hypothetical protein